MDGKSNVRIKMKRLVRFRLCPSHACTSHNAGGCLDGYGDYIIDLRSFMDAYFEATKQATDYECNKYYNKNCNCDDDDYDDDEYDESLDAYETCAYDCYAAAGLEKSCTDRNPHYDDSYQIEEFEPSQYMECARFHWNQHDKGNDTRIERFLEGAEVDDSSATYYVGPFCRHQGGTVMLGMFTDDTCSQFADDNRGRDTFRNLSGGLELPYSRVSLVGSKCISCMNQDNALEGDQADDDVDDGQKNIALDVCQSIYSEAGKCELRFGQGVLERPNTSACRYIQGIKNVRQDGIATGYSGPNGIVNLFIVLFAVSCAALGQYIQYLQNIMKHKKIARVLLPE